MHVVYYYQMDHGDSWFEIMELKFTFRRSGLMVMKIY